MTLTICGTIAFFDSMTEIKEKLEEIGHEVKLPPTEVKGKDGNLISVQEYYRQRKEEQDDDSWIWDRKAEAIRWHLEKIENSDAILVLNHEKKGVAGYIGGNTLVEMGVAFYLNKKIFLYNPIPELSYKEEILGMKPVVLNQDLRNIH